MRVVRKPLSRALPKNGLHHYGSQGRASQKAERLAEGLEIFPECGPGLAEASADEHVGILDGFLVGGAVAVPGMAGKLARGEVGIYPLAREAHDN